MMFRVYLLVTGSSVLYFTLVCSLSVLYESSNIPDSASNMYHIIFNIGKRRGGFQCNQDWNALLRYALAIILL